MLEQKFFYNMFLIIKAKYYVVVSLYWTPLLEPFLTIKAKYRLYYLYIGLLFL